MKEEKAKFLCVQWNSNLKGPQMVSFPLFALFFLNVSLLMKSVPVSTAIIPSSLDVFYAPGMDFVHRVIRACITSTF